MALGGGQELWGLTGMTGQSNPWSRLSPVESKGQRVNLDPGLGWMGLAEDRLACETGRLNQAIKTGEKQAWLLA